jgi:hypothetical protein
VRRRRYRESFTFQIRQNLGSDESGVSARPGFAVLGNGKEALREAHAVLVNGKKPRKEFSAGSEISLVFFSKVFDYYVHLDKVEQRDSKITINYFFVPHRGNGSAHFALIPLSEMPTGEVRVNLVRSPLTEAKATEANVFPPPDSTLDPIVVCRPFSFEVKPEVAK